MKKKLIQIYEIEPEEFKNEIPEGVEKLFGPWSLNDSSCTVLRGTPVEFSAFVIFKEFSFFSLQPATNRMHNII